ncbi:uncharacterized protein LOC116853656 [Odontomachus brunneus]|uniref:uncharacterized protein LOC116853656 n=1 Tax=Odontomachus brunneus TaxID=486640 RepID=UPI0013F1A0E5|nr:uncharacterized protein LOC116853656 [Odontomachus brunneus]
MDQLASTASKVLTVDDKNRPSDSTISTALTFDDTICPPEKHDVEEAFKWSHEAILLLVEEYRGHEKKMTSGKLSQKHMWELISGALRSNGYCVSGPQCQSKFNGMKRTFKSIKDHNARSGNAPRAWPYMEVMEAFLGEKPFMNPVAVASSTGTTGIESEDSDISMDNCDISRLLWKVEELAKKIDKDDMSK